MRAAHWANAQLLPLSAVLALHAAKIRAALTRDVARRIVLGGLADWCESANAQARRRVAVCVNGVANVDRSQHGAPLSSVPRTLASPLDRRSSADDELATVARWLSPPQLLRLHTQLFDASLRNVRVRRRGDARETELTSHLAAQPRSFAARQVRDECRRWRRRLSHSRASAFALRASGSSVFVCAGRSEIARVRSQASTQPVADVCCLMEWRVAVQLRVGGQCNGAGCPASSSLLFAGNARNSSLRLTID